MQTIMLRLLVVLLAAVSCVGPARADDSMSIAVLTPVIAPAAHEITARGFDTQDVVRLLEEGLRNSGHFTLYDRAKTNEDAVLAEQAFALSGKAEGNAAEFGKLRTVSLIVQPTIAQFKSDTIVNAMDENPGKFRKKEAGTININYKVLDTTTLQIKFTLNVDATIEVPSVVADKVDNQFSNDAWLELVRAITKKSVYGIGDRVFPMLVMRFKNNQIYLNRGEGTGIEVGDMKEVFSAGDDLIDPTTGKTLGATEDSLGKIRIIRVLPKFSVAVPVSQLLGEPKSGDTVR
jgi:curli production assembly/transport component CsgG